MKNLNLCFIIQMRKCVFFSSRLETYILDQKKEDFCAELQFYRNSQKHTGFFIQAETEALKLSDLRVASERGGVPPDCNSGSEESR